MPLPPCWTWRCIHKKDLSLWPISLSVRGFLCRILSNCSPVCARMALWTSVRGPGGGYLLGKDAGDIAVGSVISAVDESVDATRCLGHGGCQSGTRCLTHTLWHDLSERISSFLNEITLSELVKNQEILDVADRQNGDSQSSVVSSHRLRDEAKKLICARDGQ